MVEVAERRPDQGFRRERRAGVPGAGTPITSRSQPSASSASPPRRPNSLERGKHAAAGVGAQRAPRGARDRSVPAKRRKAPQKMWCCTARSALRSVGTPRSAGLRRRSSRSPTRLPKVCRDSAGREFAGDEHHGNADARDRSGSGEEHSRQGARRSMVGRVRSGRRCERARMGCLPPCPGLASPMASPASR